MRSSRAMTSIASGAASSSCSDQSSALASGSAASSADSSLIGQAQANGGSLDRVLDSDRAAMRLDGELAEGQAQPAAAARDGTTVRGSLHERIEDQVALRRWNPCAFVAHPDLDARSGSCREQAHLRTRRSMSDCVVEQVLEHAL